MRQNIICFVIAMIILVALGCKKTHPYQDNAVVTANKAIIDSLQGEIALRDSAINRLTTASKASVVKQRDISKSFKPVYEKISRDTSLASQLRYTQVLLSESDKWPLKRD